MEYESDFIAGAANTVAQGLLWINKSSPKESYSETVEDSNHHRGGKVVGKYSGPQTSSYLVYALSNLLAIVPCTEKYGMGNGRIACTLRGHSGNITALVHCRIESLGIDCIATIGEDTAMNIWTHADVIADMAAEWECIPVTVMKGLFSGSPCALAGFTATAAAAAGSNSSSQLREVCTFAVSDSGSRLLLLAFDPLASTVEGDSDSSTDSRIKVLSSLQLPVAQLPHSLHLTALPSPCDDVLLALFVGSVDSKIHVFCIRTTAVLNLKPIALVSSGSLQGHEDWVTCLSSTTVSSPSAAEQQQLLLASGSHDAKIRLWRIKAAFVPNSAAADTSTTQQTSTGSAVAAVVVEEEDEVDGDDIDAEDDNNDAEGGAAGASKFIATEEDGNSSEARLQFDVAAVFSPATATSTDTENEQQQQGFVHYAVLLESLLVGHEDWVTSVHWMPAASMRISSSNNSSKHPINVFDVPRLFSTSMDRNLVIWHSDAAAGGLWVPSIRMGDVGGTLGGSVGGNLLGFVSGSVSPCGSALLGVGFGGSFHLWQRRLRTASAETIEGDSIGFVAATFAIGAAAVGATGDSEAIVVSTAEATNDRWYPVPFLSGHFGAVNDITWFVDDSSLNNRSSNIDDMDGNRRAAYYIATASSDQTCRIFAPVAKGAAAVCGCWREVSRPEIHGYDLNCVSHLPKSAFTATIAAVATGDSCCSTSNLTGRTDLQYLLYTAGEEKLIRVFDAPRNVLRGLHRLCGFQDITDAPATAAAGSTTVARIEQAYIPELGLSNKALESRSHQEAQDQEARGVSQLDWRLPPLESQLADLTLWPEVKKMFGHVNEILRMVISADGCWIASSCKARDAATAQVLLWDTSSMLLRDRLPGHESSVVALAFSPNSRFLASSGKDRALCVYRSDSSSFALWKQIKSAHKRIIWDCSWTPDGSSIVTVSRDGVCKIWTVTDQSSTAATAGSGNVTCAFFFSPFNGSAVTAVEIFKIPCIRSCFSSSGSSDTLSSGSGSSTSECESQCTDTALMLGSESGQLGVWRLSVGSKDVSAVTHLVAVSDRFSHGGTVHRIRCSNAPITVPRAADGKPITRLAVASVGADCTVRVHSLLIG